MKKAICIFYGLVISMLINAQDAIPAQTIYSSNFNIDGISRICTFYIPLNYGKNNGYPLVVVLHDSGGNAKNTIKNYGELIHKHADSTASIVIYPDAVTGRWIDGSAENDSVNDAGYLSILTDYFIQRYQCNQQQVYVVGFGNGAAMAYHFNCVIPTKVTAIAAFLKKDYKPECNDASLSVMPANEIAFTVEGKLTNATINNMWEFFFQHGKE